MSRVVTLVAILVTCPAATAESLTDKEQLDRLAVFGPEFVVSQIDPPVIQDSYLWINRAPGDYVYKVVVDSELDQATQVENQLQLDSEGIEGWQRVIEERLVETYAVEPEDFGFQRAQLDDIRGGDADENAGIVLGVLKGEPGARREMVLLNAAAALIAAGRAADFPAGIAQAAEAIDSGKALEKLEAMKAITNQ